MTTMVDRPQQFGQPLHRKPLPPPGSTTRAAPPLYTPLSPDNVGHSRTRTSSSSVFPPVAASPAYTQGMQPQYQQGTRRTLSNATSSTTSTNHSGGAGGLNRTNSDLRRSSSIKSGNSPTSYVALMRKQKATVWCATAQYEDPRMLAQQRAMKMKALQEVAGGHNRTAGPRTSTSSSVAAGVRSKIRHHGAPKASLYAPTNLAGTGVPMRLSASEVDEGDSEDADSSRQGTPFHHRTGSGRSSLGSGRRVQYGSQGRLSTTSTPPSNGSPSGEMVDLPEEETPVPANHAPAREYFAEPTKTGLSGGSGSSGEGENSFGGIGQLPQHAAPKIEEYKKTSDDLRRRGSVDDRTTTMSGAGRLYIANPDLSD